MFRHSPFNERPPRMCLLQYEIYAFIFPSCWVYSVHNSCLFFLFVTVTSYNHIDIIRITQIFGYIGKVLAWVLPSFSLPFSCHILANSITFCNNKTPHILDFYFPIPLYQTFFHNEKVYVRVTSQKPILAFRSREMFGEVLA